MGLTKKDYSLMHDLLLGATVKEAAKAAGISERTAYRRRNDEEFRRESRKLAAISFQDAAGQLLFLSTKAVAKAGNLLDSDSDQIQLGAIRIVLGSGFKFSNAFNLLDRVEQLENVQKALDRKRS